ncbi:nucleotide sugar dehydrogenase [Candidatus Pelagibacter communis]|jgi:nucleotide sugar dehydrogenase|uniref:nucleotide sugar dehydrogenase n=1 Tax=Pelagibacter ubique TaxID=198252 RepID=UPI00037755BD|nr:nucleotide sugar dehydrogenase [Candidatus Pelagibacter ubique]
MNKKKIAIIGLGYVGLPLAIEFCKKKFDVFGFDIDKKKINELRNGIDRTHEVKKSELKNLKKIKLVTQIDKIQDCNVYIVTVPTPINDKKKPDLKNLIDATKLISKCIQAGDIIVYESTVYPGTTREICGKIIEKKTNLKLYEDNSGQLTSKNKKFFHLGYSPERINPGDNKHNLKNLTKLISSSSVFALKEINFLYKKICDKLYICNSIEIAEAAKIIENTQRDVNIALINELQIVFNNLKLNIYDVLSAAKTKWNFLNFEPGLVGGHCIGVDPYYLAHKSISAGYPPKLILSGRNINDKMPNYLGRKIKNYIKKKIKKKINILFLGITFKENCNDIRNSKNLILYKYLKKIFKIDVYDPVVDKNTLKSQEKNLNIINQINKKYDVIILSVKHDKFKKIGYKKIIDHLKKDGIFFDLKNMFGKYFVI